ncbi:MAG: hypothetical protein RLZZ428_1180 [Pseudomonadota bacterium]|jgi:YfiH family protein
MLELVTFENLKLFPSLVHGITTKSKNAPYQFSLALHTGEEPQSILQNREHLSGLFSDEDRFDYVVAEQTHSDHIEIITQHATKGWKELANSIKDCDALITDLKGVMLTILTADCVPILLFDPHQNVIAAIHAGWKGTRSHITAKTIAKMREKFGSNPSDIVAGIAPSIGVCCYEVGEEVASHFLDTPSALMQKGEKYMLDLPLINQTQLLQSGVKKENIQMSHRCTACEVDHFFSYRKEVGCTGRFMSMIGMKPTRKENHAN